MKLTIRGVIEAGVICMAAGVVAACSLSASTPVPPNKAASVSQRQVFAPSAWLRPCETCAKVIVTRGNGTIRGALFNIAVWADHTLVATLRPGTKIVFYLPSGHHTLAIANGKHERPDLSESLPVVLKAGAIKTYRIATSGGLGFTANFRLLPYKNASGSSLH